VMKSMPFFERNSFVLRQLLQPGWVNRTSLSAVFSMVKSLSSRTNSLLKKSGMLREPQHERQIINNIKSSPFVTSIDSVQALSRVEGLRKIFQQPTYTDANLSGAGIGFKRTLSSFGSTKLTGNPLEVVFINGYSEFSMKKYSPQRREVRGEFLIKNSLLRVLRASRCNL
jgi:hypothetical protein